MKGQQMDHGLYFIMYKVAGKDTWLRLNWDHQPMYFSTIEKAQAYATDYGLSAYLVGRDDVILDPEA